VSGWTALLGVFRGVFTAPSFASFTDLLACQLGNGPVRGSVACPNLAHRGGVSTVWGPFGTAGDLGIGHVTGTAAGRPVRNGSLGPFGPAVSDRVRVDLDGWPQRSRSVILDRVVRR
jgi:hypothetical protein